MFREEIAMGLFKSNKKQTEKDRERQQWEEIHSPEAIAARNQGKSPGSIHV